MLNEIYCLLIQFKMQFSLLCLLQLWSLALGYVALTIVHTNDIHTQFLPIHEDLSICDPSKETCLGGYARTVHLLKETRKNRQNKVLFLNEGDNLVGNMYNKFGFKIVEDFLFNSKYKLDAIGLGNHDFDHGVEGLLPLLREGQLHRVPVVWTNVDFDNEPRFPNKSILPWVIKKWADGTAIGIVGYVTPKTANTSNPGENIEFLDEIEALKREVTKIERNGAKIIIALGHSGYEKDIEIAKAVPEIDIIVGSHSHSLLWPGTKDPNLPPPSTEKPVGPYPTVVDHGDSKTLIVQASAFGKYTGILHVAFDDEGRVEKFAGDPVLLENEIPEDPFIRQLEDEYLKKLAD